MNPGGEPERDESGLPPVDIEVPDDARELDRDVQAYYREQRAQRRRRRTSRWHRYLGRDGIVLPLLACCLILALIAGTLLTVFTATSYQNPAGGPAGVGASVAPTVVPGPPPNAKLTVDGRPVEVGGLRRAMLVLVPSSCNCGATLGWLAGVAISAHAPAYLVYTTPAAGAAMQQLRSELSSQQQKQLTPALETDGKLASSARVTAGIPAGTLTAILIARDGSVTYASQPSPADQAALVRAITG